MEKMTTCKTCGAEIAKSAETCPKCGAKLKSGAGSGFLGFIILLFGIFMMYRGISGIVGDGPDGPVKVNGDGTKETIEAEDPTFAVGDTVELDDIQVTFLNFETNYGNEYFAPSDGNVFAIAQFEITNNTDSDLLVSSMASFTAYCDDYSTSVDFTAYVASGGTLLDSFQVAPGKKIAGYVPYQIPADWKVLEIHYSEYGDSSNEMVFVVENPQ